MRDKQDQAAGKGKEVVGKVTGNKRVEGEGRAQNTAGKTKRAMRDAADTVKGAAEGVRQGSSSRRRP